MPWWTPCRGHWLMSVDAGGIDMRYRPILEIVEGGLQLGSVTR